MKYFVAGAQLDNCITYKRHYPLGPHKEFVDDSGVVVYASEELGEIIEGDEEGYIRWAGGECPLPVENLVEVKFEGGEKADFGVAKAGELMWEHSEGICHEGICQISYICYYRPVFDKSLDKLPEVSYDEGYETLREVLGDAYNQAASGKGKERHARGNPFHEQHMQSISTLLGTDRGMAFQVIKKLTEGLDMPDPEARRRELLGALVYLAGIIVWHDENGVQ